MYLPNYQDGSIVNLMSTILESYDTSSLYKPLKSITASELRKSRTIVLLVIDGLGYEYVTKNGKNTVFKTYLRDKITSVFPSTTATGITTFLTGLAPQQHGITGWFMFLKELGSVSAILPFIPRSGGLPWSTIGLSPQRIFTQPPIFKRINAFSFLLMPKEIVDSDYTLTQAGKAKRSGYTSMDDFFKQLRIMLRNGKKRKFIYAYWPGFDSVCHHHGSKSAHAAEHFQRLGRRLERLITSLHDTTIIITADHGLIDTEENRVIRLKDHPRLAETLTLPLCGEPRLAYCYVHPSKTGQFEAYVKNRLHACCHLFKSEELIKRNFFGLFEPHENLQDRVGDYTLIMKENYVIRDRLVTEKEKHHIGNHGGVSKEEMYVPLIVITK
ncbi:MAG: alkaline phosphatase family protein [Nanoarchaeota archaeon]